MHSANTKDYLPLPLARLWCRKTDTWLSFDTVCGDRYLIGSTGYFVELPDGALAQIGARVAFPTVDRFPTVHLSELTAKPKLGFEAKLICVPAKGPRGGAQQIVNPHELLAEVKAGLPQEGVLTPVERYAAVRLSECGYIDERVLKSAIQAMQGDETLCQVLLRKSVCDWESMLTACLDVRPASRLDPASMRTGAQRQEWELTGEILIAMGKLTRTSLEEALRLKRDGCRAVGEILTSMGACTEEDVNRCLEIQRESRHTQSASVAVIGQLLVTRGIISYEALENAVRNQKVGRQSLEKILLSMGACSERDIEDFRKANSWHSFQDEIDDMRLGHWLEKVGTISRQQMEEALRIQQRGRQVLGELLVSMRMCTARDIERALLSQNEIRKDHEMSIEKIGALLIKHRRLDPKLLDRALQLQTAGRQKLGAILVAMKVCTADDVTFAVEFQRQWRERAAYTRDRLGDVLRAEGVVTVEQLAAALTKQANSRLPLGRILVESGTSTPEAVIAALMARDLERLTAMRAYLKVQLAAYAKQAQEAKLNAIDAQASSEPAANENSILDRFSSWVKKRK